MFGKSTGTFDRLVEKATSQLLLEPDWDATLQICDSIRQNDVQPKHAVTMLKRKVGQDNPHVAMFALQVLESCVKNCGSSLHQEVATKEFMEFLKDQVKVKGDPVKPKILELVQIWSHAFRNEPNLKVVQDTFHLMKMEGHQFPALKESDAMFMSERAPEWKDGDCCHRCRVQFTMVQRKHHCRHCGQIFCNKCSSKQSIIPKFGIEREVRVCEACFDMLNKPTGKKGSEDELPPEYLASPLSKQSQSKVRTHSNRQAPPTKSEQELQEEEELQLALALSRSEEEAKKDKGRPQSNYSVYSTVNKTDNASNATMSQPAMSTPVIDTSDMDPELAKYLNRNYWEKKSEDQQVSTTQPSAPVATSEPKNVNNTAAPKTVESYQLNGDSEDTVEQQQFLNALKSSIEIFVNRMKSNSQRGRSIANDSSVQTLFMTINAMHPQLMKYISQQEDSRAHYEALQDKLAQLKDAREALDSLREEHAEKRRREAEEQERLRQIQMAQKLEVMRQKKQEYLEYQRQLALQRMRDQEFEMQKRLEYQKQMQQMRAMQYSYPQMYQQPGTNFSPAGSVEGSPHHQPQPGGPGYMHGMPPSMGGPGGPPPSMGGPPPPGVAPPTSQPVFQPGFPPPGQPGQPQFQGPPPPGGNFNQPQGQPPVPSSGYQPTPTPGMFPPGQYSMAPQQGQQPPNQAPAQGMHPPGFQGPPQGVPDQGVYNMQNVANSLPPQGQPGPPSHPGQPPQGQGFIPPQGQFPPQGIPQGGQPEGAPQPPPPQQQEAALISFD